MTPTVPSLLVPFMWNHVRRTFDWVCDPEFRRVFLMRNTPTWESHLAYFRETLADPNQRVYAILLAGQHVGNCGFKNLAPQGRTGELWLYVGDPSLRGKGVGLSATGLLVKEGFETLGLETILLHVAEFNIPARRLYERLGFVEVPMSTDACEWVDRGFRVIRMKLEKV